MKMAEVEARKDQKKGRRFHLTVQQQGAWITASAALAESEAGMVQLLLAVFDGAGRMLTAGARTGHLTPEQGLEVSVLDPKAGQVRAFLLDPETGNILQAAN